MPLPRKTGGQPVATLLSVALVILVSLAIARAGSALFLSVVLTATIAAFALQMLFPSSRLLWIAFVNRRGLRLRVRLVHRASLSRRHAGYAGGGLPSLRSLFSYRLLVEAI
jgi:hypothetical protein